MSQPPYGAPPPPPPPAYLAGGAPAGFSGPGLPPPPPSARRTIGFVMGLVAAIVLIGFVVLVWVITANN